MAPACRRPNLLMLAGLVVGPACSQDPAPAPPDQVPIERRVGPAAVRGQALTFVGDGWAPIGGAQIVLGSSSTVADSNGIFAFGGLAPNEPVVLRATHSHWSNRNPDDRSVQSSFQRTLDLAPGAEQTVILRLLRGCAALVPAAGATLSYSACGQGGPVELVFPPGAFVRMDGAPVEAVRVELIPFDLASHPEAQLALPVDPRIDPLDSGRVIGALEVRLRDAFDHSKILIAEGETVRVRLPVAGGESVDLSSATVQSFDPETSTWSDEPGGQIVESEHGPYLEYAATHFSWIRVRVPAGSRPDMGCMYVRPRFAEQVYACAVDADCPREPNGGQRPCRGNGTCGCLSDFACAEDQVCDAEVCTAAPACDDMNPCRDGLDLRPLKCSAGTCRCRSDFQCPGDEVCTEDGCRELNASVLVRVEGELVAGGSNLRECVRVPATKPITVEARYIPSLAILAGQSADYVATPISRGGLSVWEQACGEQDCQKLEPILKPRGRSCVQGELRSACGNDCTVPLSGPVTIRDQERVVGAGHADVAGRFCASTSISNEPAAVTLGSGIPIEGHYQGWIVPSGPEGASCSGGGAACQDVGTIVTSCQPGQTVPDPGCLRARFTHHRQPQVDPTRFTVDFDASESTGAITGYEWMVFPGGRTDRPVAVQPLSASPTWQVTLPIGLYTVILTVTTGRVLSCPKFLAPECRTRGGEPSSSRQIVASSKMVYVPRARGGYGCDPGCIGGSFKSVIQLEEFLIDRTEVTQAEYQLCVDDGVCARPVECVGYDPSNRPLHPMVCATWTDADAYCRYRNARLPTEAEWDLTAAGALMVRGGCRAGSARDLGDGWCNLTGRAVFPWEREGRREAGRCAFGNVGGFAATGNRPGSCAGDTVAVASHPDGVSSHGAFDMSGNVTEWVADYYSEDYFAELIVAYRDKCRAEGGPGAVCTPVTLVRWALARVPAIMNSTGPTTGSQRVVRGDAADTAEAWTTWARRGNGEAYRSPFVGFRCAAGGGNSGCGGERGDCDLDGIPDGCQIAAFDVDCDQSGALDACEIRDGLLADADANGIPDRCERARPRVSLEGATVFEQDVGETTLLRFRIELDQAPEGEVTVDYETIDGTATAGEDYISTSGTLRWPSGRAGWHFVEVTVLGDAAYEPDETLTLQLSNLLGPAELTNSSTVGTILTDDRPRIGIVSEAYELEGTGPMSNEMLFEVTYGDPIDTPITFDYETMSGTALEGVDFLRAAGTITIPPNGNWEQVFIRVPLIGDAVPEPPETFTVQLSNRSSNAGWANRTAVGNIQDDD